MSSITAEQTYERAPPGYPAHLPALLRHAQSAGIGRLHGITLATNQAMQYLARKVGFVQRADPQDATVRQVEKMLARDMAHGGMPPLVLQ
jgi:hypothetical protein